MAVYNYKCLNVSCNSYNKIVEHFVYNPSTTVYCKHCNSPLKRQFPFSVNVIGVEKEKNGNDLGKVIKEKNESLKRKWSGYSYEEQNLRKKITKITEDKLKHVTI